MKKFVKISAMVVVALVAVLMILPVMFRGKIESVVKSEANKMLNAQFDFEKINI